MAAVTLIKRAGKAPRDKRFALKCDNDTACAAVNYGIDGSAAMREALRIWQDTCKWCRCHMRLVFIETKANRIEDALSRGNGKRR